MNQLRGDAATDLPDPSPAMGTFYGKYDGIGPWVKSASYTDSRISDAQLYSELLTPEISR